MKFDYKKWQDVLEAISPAKYGMYGSQWDGLEFRDMSIDTIGYDGAYRAYPGTLNTEKVLVVVSGDQNEVYSVYKMPEDESLIATTGEDDENNRIEVAKEQYIKQGYIIVSTREVLVAQSMLKSAGYKLEDVYVGIDSPDQYHGREVFESMWRRDGQVAIRIGKYYAIHPCEFRAKIASNEIKLSGLDKFLEAMSFHANSSKVRESMKGTRNNRKATFAGNFQPFKKSPK